MKSSQAEYRRSVKLLGREQRQIKSRLQQAGSRVVGPVLGRGSVSYSVADRTKAISAGGLGVISQLVSRLGLDSGINENVIVLKRRPVYRCTTSRITS